MPEPLFTPAPLRAWQIAALLLGYALLADLALPFGIDHFDGIIDFHHNLVVPANARHTLLHFHQLPLWNPYAKGGFLGIGAMEDGTFFPTFPLTLLFDVFVGALLEALLFTAVGALGVLLFARRLGASNGSALVLSLALVVSNTLPVYLAGGWAMHFTMVLIPLGLWLWMGQTRRHDLGLAALLALFFLRGGMYPLAYLILILAALAIADALRHRRIAPLARLAVIGAGALALAAIKLLPTLVDGDLGTARGQEGYCFNLLGLGVGLTTWVLNGSLFEGVGAIGPVAALLALVGLVAAPKAARRFALPLAFLTVYALGSNLSPARWFGGSNQMHTCAPGPSLHDLIEHVPGLSGLWNPSRALVPLGLILLGFGALGLDRVLDPLCRHLRHPATRPLLLAVVALVIVLPGFESSQRWLAQNMRPLEWPQAPSETPVFQQRDHCYKNDAFCPLLGQGSARSATFPFHAPPRGLRVASDPDYRGEQHFVPDQPGVTGRVRLQQWTPNRLRLQVEATGPGRVVINQRFQAAWRRDHGSTAAYQGLLSTHVDGSGEVTLTYRPWSFPVGAAVSALAWLGLALAWRRGRPSVTG